MRAAELPDALTSALDELAGLADESDTAVLTALRERLRAARLRVLAVGEAKRGKSTLVNALLGRERALRGVLARLERLGGLERLDGGRDGQGDR